MPFRHAPLLAVALATLVALATPLGTQAQQADSLQQLQQLSDSLQQTAERLQQTAQRLQQTAQRLQNLNMRQQQTGSQQAGAQQNQQQTSDSTQLANVPADTSGAAAQQSALASQQSDSTSQQSDNAMQSDSTSQQADSTSQQAGQQDASQQSKLDETLSALEGGVAQADPGAAVGLLESWEQTLRETDEQNLVSLASDLKQLREELQKPAIVNKRVGQLLAQIGEKTTEAASEAGSSEADKLRQLGERLSSAGQKLSSDSTSQQSDSTSQQSDNAMQSDSTSQQSDSTSQQNQDTSAASQDTSGQTADLGQQQSDLNATIVAFEQDVTGLDPVMAVGNIDGWQKALSASGDQALQSIGNDLKTLRGELQKSSVDGQKVGQLLSTLGQKTTEVAAKADPSLSPQLLQLGSLLSDAGKQLSGDQEGSDDG